MRKSQIVGHCFYSLLCDLRILRDATSEIDICRYSNNEHMLDKDSGMFVKPCSARRAPSIAKRPLVWESLWYEEPSKVYNTDRSICRDS